MQTRHTVRWLATFSLTTLAACDAADNRAVDTGSAEDAGVSSGDTVDVAVADTVSADTTSPLATWRCGLVNPFSREPECKQYLGAAWTEASAAADCAVGQYNTPGEFSPGECAVANLLGVCEISSYFGLEYTLYLGGSNPDFCTATGRACTTFLDGEFTAAPACEGAYIPPATSASSFIFEWPTQSCVPPLPEEGSGDSPGGEVCTWNLISGCTEEGRRFEDYGSCDVVRTNRPYYAVPGRTIGGDEDPRLADDSFVAESNWVREQVEACACVCCHSDRTPDGPSMWNVDDGPLFIDAMSDTAIAMFAGYVDSSAFGAFDPALNNGFDRINSALPTTDPSRTLAFFEAEFNRRNLDPAWARGLRAIGGPLIEQRDHVPGPCEADVAISADGVLTWPAEKPARYVYVLEPGSANPGMPPNLDLPSGTMWRVEVTHDALPLASGSVRYGEVPTGGRQAYPLENAQPRPLVPGETIYVYILDDIAVPIERCLLVVP
jgi:hypothetical protein